MRPYHEKKNDGTPNNAQESIIVPQRLMAQLPEIVTWALDGLLGLMAGAGFAVLKAMLDEELVELAGPKGKHIPGRSVYRHGSESTPVVLGGHKVQVDKPRARGKAGGEVPLQPLAAFQAEDLLDQAAMTKMLIGVSTRKYAKALDVPAAVDPMAVSKSAVSRRFIKRTPQAFEELMVRDLHALRVAAVMMDGYGVGDHMVIAALGVDTEGRKHIPGIREGTTGNAAVCRELLADLVDRGLDDSQGLLAVIDCDKALRKALKDVFGNRVIVQRCQVHKLRNVLDHLPGKARTEVKRQIQQAWMQTNADTAQKLLTNVAKNLEHQHPGAAASLREGLEETLTGMRLAVPGKLAITLRSTNAMESCFDGVGRHTKNVTRWKNGNQVVRWVAAALLEVEKQFRKLIGYREMPILCDAIFRHTIGQVTATEPHEQATA